MKRKGWRREEVAGSELLREAWISAFSQVPCKLPLQHAQVPRPHPPPPAVPEVLSSVDSILTVVIAQMCQNSSSKQG